MGDVCECFWMLVYNRVQKTDRPFTDGLSSTSVQLRCFGLLTQWLLTVRSWLINVIIEATMGEDRLVPANWNQ
jgi:hypothetical protein